jgi:tetratricopeptide (TPR) repeat protein
MRAALTIAMIVCAAALAGAQERMADQLKKGIVQEEANQNAEKAIQAYKAIVAQYDEERAVAATALYRLGECYRKAGMRTDAQAAYQRVVREFADQAAPRGARESQELLKAQRDLAAARQLLEESRARDLQESRSLSSIYEQTPRARTVEEAQLEFAILERRMADIKAKVDVGTASSSLDELKAQYSRDQLRYAQLLEERAATERDRQASLTLNQQSLKSVQTEMKLVEQQIQAMQTKVAVGMVSPADPALLQLQRDLLALQRKADEINAAIKR